MTGLRTRLSQLAFFTVGIVSIAATVIIFGYSSFKNRIATGSLTTNLEQSTHAQVSHLIPSFLVPEQEGGASVLLRRFVEQENLNDAKILKEKTDLPREFSKCELNASKITNCRDSSGSFSAVIAPIAEGNLHFGYLFKSKATGEHFEGDEMIPMLGIGLVILLLTFFTLFAIFARITSKEVPDSLNQLVAWLEAVLKDQPPSKIPNLRFKELNDLGKKITEVIEQHEKNREQAVIGQVAGGVLHDVRTQLQSVVTALHLAVENENGPKRIKFLENLFSVTRSKIPVIGEIIEGALDGGRTIHVESLPNDLNETLRGIVSSAPETFGVKCDAIEFIESESPVIVNHDPAQLGRVFTNLIKNGIEAHPSGSQPRVRVLVKSENEVATIIVDDDGPGLKHKPEQIFRAFRSTKVRGTGLGLLISKKIVEAHGGTITAGSSDFLHGASFKVSLTHRGKSV